MEIQTAPGRFYTLYKGPSTHDEEFADEYSSTETL